MSQWKRGRLLPFFALALIAILMGAPNASGAVHAQSEGGVTLTTQAGFDGYCKDNAWIPVRVTVENSGPDLKGRVQIAYERRYAISDAIQSEDLLIPTTSRKELVLYAYPSQGSYSMTVTLIANGKVMAENKITRSCLGAKDMLFGVLADKPGSFDAIKESDLTQGNALVAQIQVKDLPDLAQGWTGLDGLIVSGVDTGTLTETQREAMGVWLANGGKLLVVGGPQWQAAAAGLRDYLPVDVQSTQTVTDLSGLQTYFQAPSAPQGAAILAAVKPRAGATTLLDSAGLPIIVQKQVGFGEVIYIAADPSLQPLSNWDGMKSLYSRLLGVEAIRPEWMNIPWDSSASNQALSTLPELGLPSSLYICGWMALYVVVVGPLNFIILRRKKRGELAWFTVPALVIFFSVLAYLYGDVYRGNRPILNRIAMIQAWDGSDRAEVHGLVGVYSPSRAKYTLEASDSFLLYPFDTEGGSLAVQGNASTTMPDLRVEIGGMKAVSVEGSARALTLPHNLVLTIDAINASLRGSITNASPYTLRGAMLVTPGDWVTLGDLPPGGSTKVNVSLSPSSSGPPFYQMEPMSILNYMPYNNSQANQEMSRKLDMLQALLSMRSQGNWGIFLMGWLDQPMMPVSVEGQSFGTVDTSLYVDQLNPSVQYGAAMLRLTPGVMAWEASTDGASPFSQNYYGSSGSYVLRFHPAIPISYSSVQELSLYVNGNNSSISSQVTAQLWDYTSGTWVKVDILSSGPNTIPRPARYVGPGGEVRLRIEAGSNNYVGVSASTVTLVVNR